MLLKVVLFAYAQGIVSSRWIERLASEHPPRVIGISIRQQPSRMQVTGQDDHGYYLKMRLSPDRSECRALACSLLTVDLRACVRPRQIPV